MPLTVPFSIEISGVADIDPFDGLTEIGKRRFKEQMIVVGHQAVSVDFYIISRYGFLKVFQKCFFVSIINKDFLTGVTTVDDMIKSTGIFNS